MKHFHPVVGTTVVVVDTVKDNRSTTIMWWE